MDFLVSFDKSGARLSECTAIGGPYLVYTCVIRGKHIGRCFPYPSARPLLELLSLM